MSLESFGRRIEAALAAARTAPVDERTAMESCMASLNPRLKRMQEISQTLLSSVIRPRVEKLAAYFPQASLPRQPDGERCICRFGYTERFPVNAKVEFSVGHDEAVEHLLVRYELYLAPAFFKYDSHDKLTVPLDTFDEQVVGEWVERKLIEFLAMYLRIDRGDEDQEEVATDPVCGMHFPNRSAAEKAEYRGHPYYFCSKRCHEQFLANPTRYVVVLPM
jgi:YHS domain-containing protein